MNNTFHKFTEGSLIEVLWAKKVIAFAEYVNSMEDKSLHLS